MDLGSMMGGGSGGSGGMGSAISSIAGVVNFGMQMDAADKQAKAAKKIRGDANYVMKEKLRPEFQRKLRATEMAALQGLPGKDAYYDAFEQQSANAIENIKRASPNSAATLAAISASLAVERQRKTQLAAMEAKGRAEGQQRAASVMGEIGQEERKLELEKTRKKENIFAAADQMEKAATANKYRAISGLTSAVSMGGGSIMDSMIKGDKQNNEIEDISADPSGGGGTSQVIQATPSGGGGGSVNPSNMAASNAIGSNPSVGLFSVQGGGTFPMNTVNPQTNTIVPQTQNYNTMSDDDLFKLGMQYQTSGQKIPDDLFAVLQAKGIF